MKKLMGLLGIVVLFVSFASADGCFGTNMMSGTYGYGGMFFGWLISVLIVVSLVLLIVWLIKQIQKK